MNQRFLVSGLFFQKKKKKISRFAEQAELLKLEKSELEVRLTETKKVQGSKKEEVDAVLADVANLKATLSTEMPMKLADQKSKLEQEERNLEACRKDVEAKKEGRQLRKNELSMGITFYKGAEKNNKESFSFLTSSYFC